MKKNVLALCGLMLIASAFVVQPIMAQTSDWHFDLAGGVNLFQGEDDACLGLESNRYTISPVLGTGYWFNPSFGIQGSLWGGKLKGVSLGETPYMVGPFEGHCVWTDANSLYLERFNYVMFQLEGTFNFNNALCGYEPSRVWNLLAHAGVEYAYSFNDRYYCHSLGGVFGLTSTWKVTKKMNVFADYTLTIFGPEFDHVTYRDNIDDMMTLRLGLTFNLGKEMKQRRAASVNYEAAREQDAYNRESEK